MDAAVEQQPLVKAAQATQLARRRAGVDAVIAQVFEEAGHIASARPSAAPVAALQELGKGPEVAQIGLAGERPQPFLHAQIGLVILQESQIVLAVHIFDYPRC